MNEEFVARFSKSSDVEVAYESLVQAYAPHSYLTHILRLHGRPWVKRKHVRTSANPTVTDTDDEQANHFFYRSVEVEDMVARIEVEDKVARVERVEGVPAKRSKIAGPSSEDESNGHAEDEVNSEVEESESGEAIERAIFEISDVEDYGSGIEGERTAVDVHTISIPGSSFEEEVRQEIRNLKVEFRKGMDDLREFIAAEFRRQEDVSRRKVVKTHNLLTELNERLDGLDRMDEWRAGGRLSLTSGLHLARVSDTKGGKQLVAHARWSHVSRTPGPILAVKAG